MLDASFACGLKINATSRYASCWDADLTLDFFSSLLDEELI
jgi:hypothetical protein